MSACSTYQGVPPLEVLLRDLIPILVNQLERPADLGPAHALGRLCYPLALHPGLFVLKVPHQAGAGQDKEETGLP
jgi:hypothetical protein